MPTKISRRRAHIVREAGEATHLRRTTTTPPAQRSSQARTIRVTADEKLLDLIALFELTSAEIAFTIAASLRAVEERRKKLGLRNHPSGTSRTSKLDNGIDRLYSLASMLHDRYEIEPQTVRAWIMGRSAYLEEQRPASLLRAGEFDLVREAAIAFAKAEPPCDFLDARSPIPRVVDPQAAL